MLVGDTVKLSKVDGQGFCDMILAENPDLEKDYVAGKITLHSPILSPETYEGLVGTIYKIKPNDTEENDTDYYYLIVNHPQFGFLKYVACMWPDGDTIEWSTKLEKVA